MKTLRKPSFEQSARRQVAAPAHTLCAVTEIGNCRSGNEDAYAYSADLRMWVVADGMGGPAAGEIASAMTVRAIVEAIDATGVNITLGVADLLKSAFIRAQLLVSARSMQDASCLGMGSTAVAAILEGNTLHICHVGDARAYILAQGNLMRVTNDHSWVWQLVTAGVITPEQARSHPQRGKLLQAVGSMSGIKPDLTSTTLRPGDRVLLCSDGLWEALSDDEIRVALGAAGAVCDVTTRLVDRANEASGKDNITALIYQHSGEAMPEAA